MSTYQPPGEPPSYSPPQDPWAAGQGVASAPTDPIPAQPQYGQFAPGVAAPSVWSQETISHDDGYQYVPQRKPVGRYLLITLLVLALGGGGGYGAWYLITTNGLGAPSGQGTDSPSSSSSSSTTPNTSPSQADPATLKVGDCIVNVAAADKEPVMVRSDCTVAKSYKIIKIESGEKIPEGAKGTFDKETTAPAICSGTPYTAYYGWDSTNDAKDFFFCLTVN